MKITKITAGILSAAMAVTLCACGEKIADDAPALTMGNSVITKAEFEEFVSYYTTGVGFDAESAKEYALEYAEHILSVEALFEAEGLSYTDEDLAKQKEEKEKLIENWGGEESYNQQLENFGITDAFFDKMLNADYALEKIFADYVSDEQVKQNYEENYLHAKHILLATMDTSIQEPYDDAKIAEQKALADELLARAQGGEDFDAMVAEYSEDPGSQAQPEGYYFTAGEMVAEFEDTTRSLGMGEIGMCESTYGYHIIKRLPLDDNEEALASIRQQLMQSVVNEQLPTLLEEYGLTLETDQKVIDSISDK